MSTVYLGLTIYFTISNKAFIDFSINNPTNYFFALWLSMPLQLFLAIFAEPLLIPIFLLGLIGLLFILVIIIFFNLFFTKCRERDSWMIRLKKKHYNE